MLLIKLLLIAYLLCSLVMIVMVNSAIEDKIFRRVFWFLGLIMPVIFIWATLVSLFRRSKIPPFNCELAEIEHGIERERVRIFGGEITAPSFAERWEAAYNFSLQRLFLVAAKTSEKIARFDVSLHSGRAA